MNKLNLKFLIACGSLVISSNALATTEIYESIPPGLTLISELGNRSSTPDPSLYPNIATYPFPVSIDYPQGLWSNNVSSAKLSVCLADDLSSYFPPNFDAPVESAIIADIKDGSATTPSTEIEVYPNPFVAGQDGVPNTPGGILLAKMATDSGIENPNALPPATSKCYEIDVKSMLNSSNSGTLSFTLDVKGRYPDIYKDTPRILPNSPHNPVWRTIDAWAKQVHGPSFNIGDPVFVWEDYVYEKAILEVTYGPIQPGQPVKVPTLSEWSMILLMLGLAGFAATRLKQQA